MVAARMNSLVESPVREILKVIDTPGMVSFAGGLPAIDCFPQLNVSCIEPAHMQYGPSEGDRELREFVASSLQARGLPTGADRVLILSGSQQGIDLVAKLMIDRGTAVAVESPTYVAALQAFDLFGASYIPFDPLTPEIHQAKLAYTVPTFQNPTGHCYSESQRRALAHACDQQGCVLFEDDPYRELVYDDCDRTPVCSYLTDTDWIYQSSFSKVFAPGLRLGYLTCSESLFPHLVRLKQAADLHSCRISQHLILDLLRDTGDVRHELVEFYRERRDHFQRCLIGEFSDLADWQIPAGGMFFWLKLKPRYAVDTSKLLQQSIEQGVAFMPGEAFYPRGVKATPALRLNFSHTPPDAVQPALHKLKQILLSAHNSRAEQSNSV